MKLLIVKPKMIGDMLLLTPTLDALQRLRPDVEVTVLARAGTEGILAGCRAAQRIWTTQPPNSDRRRTRGASLHRQLLGERFDVLCELSGSDRGRFLSLLARAGRRVFAPKFKPGPLTGLWRLAAEVPPFDGWWDDHAVHQDWQVVRHALGLPATELVLRYDGGHAPPGWSRDSARQVVVHPATRVAVKAWPENRWAELLGWLATRFDRIVLSTGPAPAEVDLARRLAAPHPHVVRPTAGRLGWSELAAVFRESQLYVGTDTAAMHLAAACGLPVVAIWGPSKENVWAPWTARGCVVTEDRILDLEAARRYRAADPESRSPAANRVETVQRAILAWTDPANR